MALVEIVNARIICVPIDNESSDLRYEQIPIVIRFKVELFSREASDVLHFSNWIYRQKVIDLTSCGRSRECDVRGCPRFSNYERHTHTFDQRQEIFVVKTRKISSKLFLTSYWLEDAFQQETQMTHSISQWIITYLWYIFVNIKQRWNNYCVTLSLVGKYQK